MVNCQLPSALCSVPLSSSASRPPLCFLSTHVVALSPQKFQQKRRPFCFPLLIRTFPAADFALSRQRRLCGEQTGILFHQRRAGYHSLSRFRGLSGSNRDHSQSGCSAQSSDPTLDGATCVTQDEEEKRVRSGIFDEKASNEKDESILDPDDDYVLDEKYIKRLSEYKTKHNFVRVLEISKAADTTLAGARVLLLDKPGNVHSIYLKHTLLTESYYDILAALPAVIPEGPVGILGLGAGTAARLIHHFWPEIDIHGWELDPGVVKAARKFFDLEEIEWKKGRRQEGADIRPITRRRNSTGKYAAWKDESDEVRMNLFLGMGIVPQEREGRLRVHVGDALTSEVTVGGGFAGIVVDLFANGAVIPALQEVESWRQMREKLRPGGRIMVNCGGSCVEAEGKEKKDGGITMRETIDAIDQAFPGELSILHLNGTGDNSLALTGPTPDLGAWMATLPDCLRVGIEDWKPFSSSS